MKLKLKYLSLLVSLLTVMLFVVTGPFSVLALEENSVPDIENEKKSLTVYFFVQLVGVDTPIEGAEVGIYRIADLKTSFGSANYTVLDKYAELKKTQDDRDVTFEGISVSESIALAKKFAVFSETPEMTAVTDKNGMCRFDDLEQGMYLVKELSASGEAQKYQLFEPYMISVPLAVSNIQTGGKIWQYDVLSEPKTKVSSGSHSEMSTGTSEVSNPEQSIPETSISETSISEPSKPSTVSQPSQQTSQPSQSSQSSNPIFTGDTSYSVVVAMVGVMFASLAVVLMTKNKKEADDNE